MHSKAIDAGALAIFREHLLLDDDECRRAAQAAITAYLAAMEAEGLVMVPVEPTEAMWDAAKKESARIHHSQHWGWIYAAMLAARPTEG